MDASERLGERKTVDLGGGRTIAYRERGHGDAVLFVHGALANGLLWRDVVPHLGHLRCVVPDLPLGSHAIPMPPDADMSASGLAHLLAELIERLDLADVTVVANDAGGAITQILMTRWPQRLAGVVLTPCDTFGGFPPGILKLVHATNRIRGATRAATAPWALRPVQELFFRSVAHRRIGPAVRAAYTRPWREHAGVRRDVDRLARTLDPAATLEASRRLPDFTKPVLIVWGEDDRWFPLRNARRLAELLPNARLEVVRRARTFLPEDQPERLAALIADFTRA